MYLRGCKLIILKQNSNKTETHIVYPFIKSEEGLYAEAKWIDKKYIKF